MNTLVAIVLQVCTLSDGNVVCHSEPLPGLIPKMECTLLGQMYLTRWLDEHPKWFRDPERGWTCHDAGEGRPT